MTSDDTSRLYRRGVLRSIAGVGALAGGGVVAADPGRSPGPRETELLVGCVDDADPAAVAASVEAMTPESASVTHRNETLGYVAVSFRSGESARKVFGPRIDAHADVDYVEDNLTLSTQLVPNDPRWDEQYAPELVNADDAWETTFGSTDVTIAVVDTGIEYTHPDLDDLFAADAGRDFAADDGDPQPATNDELHGTHVTGCASANTDNGVGVAGTSDSRLLAARALDASGSGSVSDIADGIQWATDQGASIINLSLGGGSYSSTLKRAVEYAYDQNDVLVVAAAGNEGQADVSYPARYEECVAVSAIDPDETLADFSNYGPNVEVTAPGVNVLSTVPPNDYRQLSGTSMASPVAAGVAALGLAVDGDLSASELRQLLGETAVDVGLPADQQGEGRVDAANVVAAASPDGNGQPTAVATASDTDVSVDETVTFDGSGSSVPDGSVASYEWTFGDGTSATGAVVEHTYESAGEYTATLTVTADDGATATDGVTVTVGTTGACSETVSGSVSGSLNAWWDQDRYTWNQQFDDTCEVTVSLDGPANADFDLYVTADGRRPTTSDYDARSVSSDSTESVTLTAVDGGVGVLVDSYAGGGQYQLVVEEVGSDATVTAADDSLVASNESGGSGSAQDPPYASAGNRGNETDDGGHGPGRGPERGRRRSGDARGRGKVRGRGSGDD